LIAEHFLARKWSILGWARMLVEKAASTFAECARDADRHGPRETGKSR
jgi:hypothetical protein